MKRIFVLTLLIGFVLVTNVFGADWSKYASGRDNIKLEGYQLQPGYIQFEDGNGTILGYLWMDTGGRLVSCSRDAHDLTTTRLHSLSGTPGVIVGDQTQ